MCRPCAKARSAAHVESWTEFHFISFGARTKKWQSLLCRRCKFKRNCRHLHLTQQRLCVFQQGGAVWSRGGRVGGGVAVRNGEWRKAARVGGWRTGWRGLTRRHQKRCSCCWHVCVYLHLFLCVVFCCLLVRLSCLLLEISIFLLSCLEIRRAFVFYLVLLRCVTCGVFRWFGFVRWFFFFFCICGF